MRLFRGPAQSDRTPSINLAVQLAEFVEEKGALWVKGKRLDTGEEVFVTLTDKGELANNRKRPPLSDFRDKRNNLGMEIGGVIGFDRCYPNGTPGRYLAGWPTWFVGSDSAEDMKRVKLNRQATLEIRAGGDRLFGTLSIWQPENIIEFPSLQNLEAASAKWLNDVLAKIKNAHGAAIMRGRNAAGEVVSYTRVFARKEKKTVDGKDSYEYETGDTTLTNFKASRSYEAFVQESTANGAVKFDIVPAINLEISPRALDDGGNAFKATERSYQRDGEYFTKGTTFVMDPNHKFVIKVMVHDPYGESGVDPVLLGKGGYQVTYNAAFKASLDGAPPSTGNQPTSREPVDSGPSMQV